MISPYKRYVRYLFALCALPHHCKIPAEKGSYFVLAGENLNNFFTSEASMDIVEMRKTTIGEDVSTFIYD